METHGVETKISTILGTLTGTITGIALGDFGLALFVAFFTGGAAFLGQLVAKEISAYVKDKYKKYKNK